MYCAIETKYIWRVGSRPALIKATSERGGITILYDKSVDLEQNHKNAMLTLCENFGWNPDLYVCGSLPETYVWVRGQENIAL